MVRRADAKRVENLILPSVHGSRPLWIMVIVSQAVKQAMGDVEESLHGGWMITLHRLAERHLSPDDDFHLDMDAIRISWSLKVKGENISRPGNPLVLQVQPAHFAVIGQADRDLPTSHAEDSTGFSSPRREPALLKASKSA